MGKNHKRPFSFSQPRSLERQLHSETCQITDFGMSTSAAGEFVPTERPLLSAQLSHGAQRRRTTGLQFIEPVEYKNHLDIHLPFT